eukprot:CAMPEP_0203815026 /NCGR_PEP_ID=MMETSP0115-20131106/7444_1 /ASSEMBLY_ACC=CAM_ASM_000227 /TAXON_ID=33651 /ORGANISM="Bicosoecid sp, Strain ms1" /LENGTH=290 /DNA_ID=CAMNT_0050723915 /DNA_START=16 /DNA_END=888 /DNA_ORIENTATION=-
MAANRHTTIAAALLLFAACVAGGVSAYNGIGDRVEHTFLKFDALPLSQSEAEGAGWTATGGCIHGRGTPYVQATPTSHHPLTAYYTAGGQLSAVSLAVFGDVMPALVEGGWFEPRDTESHTIALGFREPSGVCSGSTYAEPVGDRVVANPGRLGFNIPLTRSDALGRGFFTGGCIGGMGVHHSLDLNSPGRPTWNASSLMPFTPMYDETSGHINAVLFQTSVLQQGIPVVGDYEGPFINSLLAYNYCSDSCADALAKSVGTGHLWNTMHFLFHDHSLNKCSDHCPFGNTP